MGFGESFASSANQTASMASKWLNAYDKGKQWRQDDDIKSTVETAQKAWDERKSAIDADTSMTQYDRDQAHAEARGQYYDTLQKKYEQYGMGEQFNNMITAAGNARKENIDNMVQTRQTSLYKGHQDATQARLKQGFAKFKQGVDAGDKKALERLSLIGAMNNSELKSINGQIMWRPQGSDAEFVPVDMATGYDSWVKLNDFESKLRSQWEAEAFLNPKALENLDTHEGKKEAIATSKVARQKATADQHHYSEDGSVHWVTDGITGERKYANDRKGESIHTHDVNNVNRSYMESGENQEMVETVQDGLSTEGRKTLGKPRTVRRGNEVFVSFNYKGKRVEKPYAVFAEYVNQMKSKGSVPATTGKQKRRAISEESY